jgi:hypothetical protein
MSTSIKIIFLSLFVLTSITASTFGQERVEFPLCEDIKSEIILQLKPVNFHQQDFYEDECNFGFRVENYGIVSVDIRKHKSNRESHRAFERDYKVIIPFSRRNENPKLESINTDNFWTEAFAVKGDLRDHAIFLRYKKFTVTLLSSDYRLLQVLESHFRKFQFGNY